MESGHDQGMGNCDKVRHTQEGMQVEYQAKLVVHTPGHHRALLMKEETRELYPALLNQEINNDTQASLSQI